MEKIKSVAAFILVLLVGSTVEARSDSVVVEDFGIGHISGRQSVIVQGGVTGFKELGKRGMLSYSYAHSSFYQSRPFLSFSRVVKRYPDIALGYNMGFSLVDSGKRFCMRLLAGPAWMMILPKKRKASFNFCLVGEMEMELSLFRWVDLLVSGGGRYVFLKSRLGRLTAHATVGLKFNF